MAYHKIAIEVANWDHAQQISGFLQNLSVGSTAAVTVFESGAQCGTNDHWRVEAYYEAIPDKEALGQGISWLIGGPAPQIAIEAVPDLNWVAISQTALPPVRAGRFTIFGSHDQHRIPNGPNTILIDAGEAFGTAHHATTYGCLRAIDRITRTNFVSNAVDLGCGSGVLAIALARAQPKCRVVAADVDPQAVRVATKNIRINGAGQRITTLQSDGLCHPVLRERAPFDLVIANILAAPLISLSGDLSHAILTGGKLILAGLLQHQAPRIIATCRAHGLELSSKMVINGWTTLILTRRGSHPIRRRH